MVSLTLDKLIRNFPFINIVLVLVSNLLIFWTWLRLINTDEDIIFLGLYVVSLLLLTIYYLLLLKWSIKAFKNRFDFTKRTHFNNMTMLLMNIIPITLIYYYTTK
jgi:hypothetical protein